MMLNGRLNFTDIPYLRDVNARLFSAAELIWYPPIPLSVHSDTVQSKSPMDSVRGSLGFGLSIPINEQISFALYYNAANFGSRQGDIERQSWLSVDFQLF
jgi:hypothetical protein